MEKLVVFAAGTSVLRGLEKRGIRFDAETSMAQLTDALIADLSDDVSAEVSTVAALGLGSDDRVILLATDTGAGARAAYINARILSHRCDAEVRRIEGLSLDDAVLFRKRGLPALVEVLDRVIGDGLGDGHEVTISVGTGLKVLTPYLALYGMLRGVELCYMFEQAGALIRLPRLPVAFDYDLLARASRAIIEINTRTVVPVGELRGRLGPDFERLEGLFDEAEPGLLTLSPFGFLVLGDLAKAAAGTILLSPSARQTLDGLEGVPGEQLAFMVARSLDPLWRHSKAHKRFAGSDLDVFKPGRTGQRMAGWVGAGNTFYVAELYPDHDTYERDLRGRRRADYPLESFEPWEPPFRDALTDPEREGEQLLRVVEQRERESREALAVARQEADDALALAARVEAEGREAASRGLEVQQRLEQDLARLQEHTRALESEMGRRTSGAWYARVWRALQGR